MHDVEDDLEAARRERTRRAADLKHIRDYYRLEEHLGVRVEIGGRVRHDGREGAIVDTAGQYLLVLRDGDEQPVRCHVTSSMEYATDAGWVRATPRPDSYASIPTKAAPTPVVPSDTAPVSDGTMPCPVPAPETRHPCVKPIPKGWTADEGYGGGHFWQAPAVAALQARGAHYDAGTLLSGQPTPWHLPQDCTPDCWKWSGR
jgi:hypothetical protein